MEDIVGLYKFVRSLGEGGMGVAYEAKDSRLDRSVALKTLLTAGNDPSARERLPLSARDKSVMHRDVPRTPRAYELYLRANQMAVVTDMLPAARDAYLACLAEDPRDAPAWARLGRVHRAMAKYGMCKSATGLASAEQAFRKALEINPDLAIAHHLYTHYEVEERAGARSAMTRLLARAQSRPADPELFAALVLVLRFGGLLDASVAADRRARSVTCG